MRDLPFSSDSKAWVWLLCIPARGQSLRYGIGYQAESPDEGLVPYNDSFLLLIKVLKLARTRLL